jgi:hypothetical protein
MILGNYSATLPQVVIDSTYTLISNKERIVSPKYV